MRYNEISKITDFHPRHLHLAPPLAVTFEFLQDAWHQKTRIPRLMYMYIFCCGTASFWQRDLSDDYDDGDELTYNVICLVC